MLLEFARFMDDKDEISIEIEGYECVPYAVEVDEFEGVLRIKAYPPDNEEEEEKEDDDDSVLDDDDDLPWDELSCEVPERPIESMDISEEAPREG